MSIYYEHDGITLHLGDCLEILPTFEAGSVDAVITDPPYVVYAGAGGGAFGNRAHLVNTGDFTDGGSIIRFWVVSRIGCVFAPGVNSKT